MTILEQLFSMQDFGYRAFQCKLMPTVDPETVIGVRTPALRKLAKALGDSGEAQAFLQSLPHQYYEENNLHAFLIEAIRDYDACIAALDAFLPFVDNWATCDSMSPPVLKAHPERLIGEIDRWMASEHVYTVRFGMGMLLRHCLDEHFRPEYLQKMAACRSDEYYINMMIAWYFATALAKQYDAALTYIENRRLEPWTHNKAIQKAVESFRVPPEHKEYLKTLKIPKERARRSE